MTIVKHGLFEDVIENYMKIHLGNGIPRQTGKYLYRHAMNEDKNIVSLVMTSPEGASYEEHFHDWIEFTLVINGEHHIWIEDNEYILTDGDFIMIDYNKIHHSHTFKDADKMTIQFKRGFIESLIPEFDSSHIYCTSTEIKDANDMFNHNLLTGYYVFMVTEFEKCSKKLSLDFKALFYAFFATLIKYYTVDTTNDYNYTKNSYVKQMLLYINKNYNQEITLQDLSQSLHLTPEYISKIMKKELGCGFKQYLTKLRVEHAKVMIKTTDKSLMRISEDCGFPNNKSFTTHFTKIYGMTPSEYRKTLKRM